jgi:putative ABC transport system ATP-binding protein
VNPNKQEQDTPLQISGLAKRYGSVAVFEGVDLQVAAGQFVAIIGDSGVGKSTLLNCMAGLDHWDAGEVRLCGQPLSSRNDDQRALLRRQHVGFVFQAFHVLPHLDVAQNVALPLMLLGQDSPERVAAMLKAVGLQGLGERLPAQLSGGQLQRVAIARALVHQPALLLADEPTGNLDPSTAARVMDALTEQCLAQGSALVLVTHSDQAAARAHRVLRLTAQGLEGA